MMRLIMIALLVGCVDTPPLQEPVVEASHVEIKQWPQGNVPKLDILIVVDDSVAMVAHRDRVATIAPPLVSTLRRFAEGWTNLRIVVSSNDGRARRLPGMEHRYLVDAIGLDYARTQNYAGTLEDALAALIDVGTESDGPSQPLEGMRRSLETNSEFLREDEAALVIVMISARDDASPLPVADYVQWMEAATGTGSSWRRSILVAGIYPEGSSRLDEYLEAIHTYRFVAPIEAADFTPALAVFDHFVWQPGVPCLESELLDLDTSTPGLQYDCSVMANVNDAWRAIPRCAAPPIENAIDQPFPAPLPSPACWSLRSDTQSACRNSDRLRLDLDGYTYVTHPAFRFECVTQ
ncbi:MAG TPA: hypothetical protein VIV11_27040 [Kofleriaceae bacterium]